MASKVAVMFQAVSPVALRLVGLLEKSGLPNEEIVNLLKHDTLLTAKLLRACNSPSLGFAEPIGCVDQAVLLLGHQEILRMVLALAFGEALARPLEGYAVEATELWCHSVVVGLASEVIAQETAALHVDQAIAFTAGLLHDIGKMAITQALTADRQAAIRYRIAELGNSRIEAERAVLGTDHAEVGGCLLSLWRLPEQIVEAVANHHEPISRPCCQLSALLCLANCVAHLAGSAPGWEAYAINPRGELAAAFALSPEKLEILVIKVREAAQRAEFLMNN